MRWGGYSPARCGRTLQCRCQRFQRMALHPALSPWRSPGSGCRFCTVGRRLAWRSLACWMMVHGNLEPQILRRLQPLSGGHNLRLTVRKQLWRSFWRNLCATVTGHASAQAPRHHWGMTGNRIFCKCLIFRHIRHFLFPHQRLTLITRRQLVRIYPRLNAATPREMA